MFFSAHTFIGSCPVSGGAAGQLPSPIARFLICTKRACVRERVKAEWFYKTRMDAVLMYQEARRKKKVRNKGRKTKKRGMDGRRSVSISSPLHNFVCVSFHRWSWNAFIYHCTKLNWLQVKWSSYEGWLITKEFHQLSISPVSKYF